MSNKGLLFGIATLGFIALAFGFFYQDRSFKSKVEGWYSKGRKAVGY